MTPQRESWRVTAALAALGLATFAFVTTENIPVGLLPQLAHSLHRSRSATGYLVTAYALVVVVGSVPLALLTRRFTRKRLLTGALVVFVLGCAAGAAAQTYGQLLGTRLAIASGHCVFWAVVAAAGAALVPRDRRGHALAMVFSGSSLASVVGIPAVTWLGQQTSWRVSTLAASGLGLVSLTAIFVLLPPTVVEEEQQEAPHPSVRRFTLVQVALALTMTGAFAMLTYITVFLLNLGGFSTGAISPILLVSGAAGAAGVLISARFVAHHARPTMTLGVAGLTASLAILALVAHHGTLDVV
ncbi:MAG TPA: MFS transporter, partial [Gaiellaceae bacterium]|nr:MFS transporter [Gaiellaceae bacterium]